MQPKGFVLWGKCVWWFCITTLLGVGCQSPAEELLVPDWTPILAVPLVDTQFDLQDVLESVAANLDSLPIESGAGGELVFVYSEDFSGTLAEAWLTLPDVVESSSFSLDEGLASLINLSDEGESFLISDTIVSEMIVDSPPGALVDLIELEEGELSFTVTSAMGDDVEGQLLIPNLVDAVGMPWSVAWTSAMLSTGTFSVTENLSGWRILPENPNVQDTNLVRALFDVYLINNGDHTAVGGETLSADFAMDGLVFSRVEGDFGSSEIYLEEGTSTLNLFDDRFTSAGIGLERATLTLEVTNAFGVEAILDSLDLLALQDGEVVAEFETTAQALAIPPASGSAASPSVTTWVLDETNSNIASFFSVEPRTLELSAWVRSNPDGVDPMAPNFVDADGYVFGSFRADIPLSIKVEQLDFVDTTAFDFDLEDTVSELDSASLRVILHNGFPFGVTMSLLFLDDNGQSLDSLSLHPLPVFTLPSMGDDGLPVEPGLFVHDIPLDWDRANRLTDARQSVIRIWTETSGADDGAFVHLTQDQFLKLEMAAKLYPRIQL